MPKYPNYNFHGRIAIVSQSPRSFHLLTEDGEYLGRYGSYQDAFEAAHVNAVNEGVAILSGSGDTLRVHAVVGKNGEEVQDPDEQMVIATYAYERWRTKTAQGARLGIPP